MGNMYFEVPGEPQGKARARMGNGRSYTPQKTVLYENLIKTCFLAEENKQTFFNKEPVVMAITAYYSIPKSTTKKDRERMINNELFPTKKPDADNIAKVVCDALNGVAYYDDTQVVNLMIKKKYTQFEPRLTIMLGPYDGYPF